MTRRTVPFVPVIEAGKKEGPSAQASMQLNALIASQEALGWRFLQLEGIPTVVSAGCLASLFGHKTSWEHLIVAVFEHD